jgi:hypothetical protein
VKESGSSIDVLVSDGAAAAPGISAIEVSISILVFCIPNLSDKKRGAPEAPRFVEA